MAAKNKIFQVVMAAMLWFVLAGCGLLGGNSGLVGRGVAFPPPADSPPTAESSLPQPVVNINDEGDTTTDPTAEIPTPIPTNMPQPPTAVPQPIQPPPTTIPPQIHSFTAESTGDKITKTITFTWESSGAATARIYNWANGSMRFPSFWDVPTSGALTIELSGTRRKDPQFELFIYEGESSIPADTGTVQIPWDCAIDYFFEPGSNICPHSEAIYTTAVIQNFQGGQMIWLEALDWVYVLYDEVIPDAGQGGDLQWERFGDDWSESVAEDLSLIPPPGFYAPVRGFSLVWRQNPAVQERLGWALSPEEQYEGAWQLQPSDTDNIGDGAIFLQLQNGQVARLAGFDDWGWLWETVNS